MLLCSALNEGILKKVRGLESKSSNLRIAISEERCVKLNEAIAKDLKTVAALQIDGSVLKNTGVVKTLKSIITMDAKLINSECTTLASSIIHKWKEQVKEDNKSSTIRNMKGGKLVSIGEEGAAAASLNKPRCLPTLLWNKLRALYNDSQLFAIKYVSDRFEDGQDTRIALIQGTVIFLYIFLYNFLIPVSY